MAALLDRLWKETVTGHHPAPEDLPGVGTRTLVRGARQFHFYSCPINGVLIWVKTCFNRRGSWADRNEGKALTVIPFGAAQDRRDS